MPLSPLTWLAKMPERLLPMPVERNQPPMPNPTRRIGASFVTIERPMGDRHSSPTDWITYTMNNVQNGINPAEVTIVESASMRSANASPLKTSPSPNFLGMDGFIFPSLIHS